MSCQETFFRELRQRGLRLTPQREIVLSVMHQIEGLATAEEIHRRVQEFTVAVDISTVYRTLELLKEFGVVMEVEACDGQRRYELITTHGHHIYLTCNACGAVIAADLEPARRLAAELQATYGFAVDLHRLSVPGLCQACQATRSDTSRGPRQEISRGADPSPT